MTFFWILRIYLGIGAGFGLFIFIGISILKKLYKLDWYMQRRAKFNKDEDFPKFVTNLDDWALMSNVLKAMLAWPLIIFLMIFKRSKA